MPSALKLLLIDNNDSFTYNIVNIIRKYKFVDLNIVKYDDLIPKWVNYDYDKVIISPGPGNPSEYAYYDEFLKTCVEKNIHVLGICLGHQIIAEHFGAKTYNLNTVFHGQNKMINIIESSILFRGLPRHLQVGLYHSWAVHSQSLPQDLTITATSEDNIIMAIQHKKYPIFGLQFHPESYITKQGETIIKNFIYYDT